jgi:hypothetical protein
MLTNEIELIQDDKLREFVVEAIAKDTDSDEQDAGRIRQVIYYLKEFCEVVDADDAVKDVMIVAGLIYHLDFEQVHPHLQPSSLRIYLNDLMPIIGREAFDNIMYLVSRQMGFKTVIPELTLQINDPIHVWLLPMAISLASKEV